MKTLLLVLAFVIMSSISFGANAKTAKIEQFGQTTELELSSHNSQGFDINQSILLSSCTITIEGYYYPAGSKKPMHYSVTVTIKGMTCSQLAEKLAQI
ncbi:MAG TPA: hypothetical protein VE912_19085 [Bacteroidales bacterium]|nr:hypothetical protein [Bacteroidales bacterium]